VGFCGTKVKGRREMRDERGEEGGRGLKMFSVQIGLFD